MQLQIIQVKFFVYFLSYSILILGNRQQIRILSTSNLYSYISQGIIKMESNFVICRMGSPEPSKLWHAYMVFIPSVSRGRVEKSPFGMCVCVLFIGWGTGCVQQQGVLLPIFAVYSNDLSNIRGAIKPYTLNSLAIHSVEGLISKWGDELWGGGLGSEE